MECDRCATKDKWMMEQILRWDKQQKAYEKSARRKNKKIGILRARCKELQSKIDIIKGAL